MKQAEVSSGSGQATQEESTLDPRKRAGKLQDMTVVDNALRLLGLQDPRS